MSNKYAFFSILFFAVALALFGVGFATWGIGSNSGSAKIEDVVSYDVIDYGQYLDLTTSSSYYETAGRNISAFKYYDTGFLDISSNNIVNNTAVVRCYYSLIPKNLNIENNSFNLKFELLEKDSLNLMNGVSISSKVVQQVSAAGFTERGSSSTNIVSYNNINSSYSVRLYMYVEYVLSGINFVSFKNNIANVDFELKIEVENDNRSIWKLLKSEQLVPQKDSLTYIANNLDGKEKSYSGNSINVFTDSSGNIWDFLGVTQNEINSKYNIYYNAGQNGIDDWTTSLPSNAGEYEFRITYKSGSSEHKEFSFGIVGTKIYALTPVYSNREISDYIIQDYAVIELAYDECSTKTWGANFESYIKDKLSFATENGLPALTDKSQYSISKITDLSFTYTRTGNTYSATVKSQFSNISSNKETYLSVVGSTYRVTISLTNGGYSLSNVIILKYKTAYLPNYTPNANENQSKYFTIEDAIARHSQITLAANANNSSYVTTSFSDLIKRNGLTQIYNSSNYSITSNLIVPDENLADSHSNKGYRERSGTSKLTASCLYIPSNVSVQTTSNIFVESDITTYGQTQQHGVLMNDGILTLSSGSYLYSFGYTKGKGIIYSLSGSNTCEMMRIIDYAAGSSANTQKDNGAFPFYNWKLNNISCPIRIYKGAIMNVFVYITGGSQYHPITTTLISASNSGNSLFSPDSGATNNDYILKYGTSYSFNYLNPSSYSESNDPNTKVTSDNQDNNRKSVIELYGKYKDNKFKISASVLMFSITIETGKKYSNHYLAVPISFLDIVIQKNSIVSLSNTPFIFLPGTMMIIEEGASVSLSNIFLAFDKVVNGSLALEKDCTLNLTCNGYMVNNGTMTINSGNIGGEIRTTVEGAIINNLTNVTDKLIRTKKGDTDYYENSGVYPCFENKNIDNTIVEVNLTNGNYESVEENGEYHWQKVEADISSYVLMFYDENELLYSTTIYSTNDTYTFSGDEYIPQKKYYNFVEWKFANNNSASGTTIYPNDPCNVYASWTPKQYSLNYNMILNNSVPISANAVTNYPAITTFTYESNFPISIPIPIYEINNKVCVSEGWIIYIDAMTPPMEQLIGNSISLNAFIALENAASSYGLDLADFEIPLLCNFYDYDPIKVEYVNNFTGYTNYNPTRVEDTNTGNFYITLPMITYDTTDITKEYIPYGWTVTIGGSVLNFAINESVMIQINNGIYSINGNVLDENIYHDTANNIWNVILYAKWEPKDHTVNHYLNDGTQSIISQYYNDNQQYSIISNPTREGYQFDGWYYDSSCSVGQEFDSNLAISSSFDLYAKWISATKITFSYGFTYNGSNSSYDYYAPGTPYSDIVFPVLSRTGYDFMGWYTQQENGTLIDSTYQVGQSAQTLYAVWQIKKFTVTIAAGANGTVSPSTIANVPYGATVSVNNNKITINGTTVTATANSNYAFDAWTGNPGTITNNVTITATFKSSGCVSGDTLVLMADGTEKEIKDVKIGDLVWTWNFYEGYLEVQPVTMWWYHGNNECYLISLSFNNGCMIDVINEHGFFDLTLNEFVFINQYNYQNFCGHKFVMINGNQVVEATLEYTECILTIKECYSIRTAYNDNAILNGALSLTIEDFEGITTTFKVSENMTYDKEYLDSLVSLYGLYTYDEWAEYMPEYIFEMFQCKYYKIYVGLGILKVEDFFTLLDGLFENIE